MPRLPRCHGTKEPELADLVVIVGVIAFFVICVLYVAGLDRLVGPDDEVDGVAGTSTNATR